MNVKSNEKHHFFKESKFQINYKDETIKQNIISEHSSVINEYIKNEKPKSEYEKEESYKKRINNVSNIYNTLFPLSHFEYKYLKENIKIKFSNYDSENETLQITFDKVKPLLIKVPNNKIKEFVANIKSIKFSSLEIDIISEDLNEIKNGVLIDEFDNNYIINNELPFENPESIKEEATKILEKSKELEILAEVNFVLNSVDSNFFISNKETYLNDYIKKYGEEIDANRKRKYRIKKEFESLTDYQKSISVSSEDRPFSYSKIYSIFKTNHSDFNFMKYISQEYDAENEVFKIAYSNFNPIYIQVPINQASSFGAKLKNKSLVVKDAKFLFLDDKTIFLKELHFKDFNSFYDATKSIKFKTVIIKPFSKENIIVKKHKIPLSKIENTITEENKEIVEVPFMIIQTVPIFPGCLGSNKLLKKCMSDGINKFLQKKIDFSIDDFGLSNPQRVFISYTISKDGLITNVICKTNHPKISSLVKKIIYELPKMKPSTQRGRPVSWKSKFSLTIN